MKVLLVEDTTEVQQTITRLLTSRGHAVIIAENGLEAFARLGEGGYDAIICDLALPFLQGNQFYRQVGETYPEMARRTVFVTGFASDETTKTFLEETGQPYLAKPFEATDLLAAIERVSRSPEAGT